MTTNVTFTVQHDNVQQVCAAKQPIEVYFDVRKIEIISFLIFHFKMLGHKFMPSFHGSDIDHVVLSSDEGMPSEGEEERKLQEARAIKLRQLTGDYSDGVMTRVFYVTSWFMTFIMIQAWYLIPGFMTQACDTRV